MYFLLIISVCVLIILALIVINVVKIKYIETEYDGKIKQVLNKIHNLNAKISKVINENNAINVKNIEKVISHLATVKGLSESNDINMNLELESYLYHILLQSKVYQRVMI